jgi:hypothetical protein
MQCNCNAIASRGPAVGLRYIATSPQCCAQIQHLGEDRLNGEIPVFGAPSRLHAAHRLTCHRSLLNHPNHTPQSFQAGAEEQTFHKMGINRTQMFFIGRSGTTVRRPSEASPVGSMFNSPEVSGCQDHIRSGGSSRPHVSGGNVIPSVWLVAPAQVCKQSVSVCPRSGMQTPQERAVLSLPGFGQHRPSMHRGEAVQRELQRSVRDRWNSQMAGSIVAQSVSAQSVLTQSAAPVGSRR